jgi:hypothetical protein
VIVFVDPDTCVALRVELFEHGDTPRKVLAAPRGKLIREGGRWFPQELELRDLRDGTATRLRARSIQTDVDLPERLFNPSQLGRGG